MNIRSLSAVCSLALVAAVSTAHADAPVVTVSPDPVIVQPGATFATVFFNAVHAPLADTNALKVWHGADLSSELADVGNPFHNGTCTNVLAETVFASCTINTADDADVAFKLPITGPGTYNVRIQLRHGGQGIETENGEVSVALEEVVIVEHPAPPAVANAHINAIYKNAIKAKQRGCVISYIAENHAQLSYYGDKGGPYDTDLIKADVSDALTTLCK